VNHLTLSNVTPEILPALEVAARADDHGLVLPTHLVKRGEEIRGYFSMNAAPLLCTWLDSKRVVARESILLLNSVENYLRLAGHKNLITTCTDNSPFRPFMADLGFRRLGTADFFLKNL
jgi:hypothetical protein